MHSNDYSQALDLQVRYAEFNDCLDLFKWRNDFLTRKMSLNSSAQDFNSHEAWYLRKLDDPFCQIYIGVDKGKDASIGMVRFDRKEGISIVSINLNPQYRGLGLSEVLLSESIRRYFFQVHDIAHLEAYIKEINVASVRVFTKVGFSFVESVKGLNLYRLSL